jgi:hypothetical protein
LSKGLRLRIENENCEYSCRSWHNEFVVAILLIGEIASHLSAEVVRLIVGERKSMYSNFQLRLLAPFEVSYKYIGMKRE